MGGWIGVDFDGTLAHYKGWDNGKLGEPVPAMVERVKEWLTKGVRVKVFTARVSALGHRAEEVAAQRAAIEQWTETHLGQKLPVVCCKDYAMIALFDDRAFTVEQNTGRLLTEWND